MTRNIKMLTLGLVATLAIGGVALAGPGGPGGPGAHLGRLVEKLNLTEDQQVLAQQLREDGRANHEQMREQRTQVHEAILEELESGNPDRKRIRRMTDDNFEAMKAAANARTDALFDLYDALDDEQRATLVAELKLMKERREAHRDEMGEGGQRGPREGGPREGGPRGDW